MKGRIVKRVLSMSMAVLLSASMVLPVFADDDIANFDDGTSYEETDENAENDGEYQEDYGLYDDCDEEEAIPEYTDADDNGDGNFCNMKGINDEEDASYSISVEESKISFGTNVVGSAIDGQEIKINNNGNRDVKLIWKETDPDGAFDVISPDTDLLRVGETITFLVNVNHNLGEGAYSASVLFADETDPVYDSGVQVSLSVTMINEEQPVIKRVTITPCSAEASPGSSLDFSANVEGEGDFDNSVSYSVAGNKSTDTNIDSNGHLSIGGNENASTIKITATANGDNTKSDVAVVSIKANMHTVNISASPSEGGKVTGGGNYKEGDRVILGASPNRGWSFDGWKINGEYFSGTVTYEIGNINSDVTAEAMFSQEKVYVKAEPNHKKMGKVYGSGEVEKGGSITLEAEEKDGFVFKCWMEGQTKVSTDHVMYVQNVTSDRTFKAVFAKDKCKVKVASNDETMGKVSGGGKVEVGDSVSIKAIPNSGYKFEKWLWNDSVVSESAEYTLKDVKDDMCLVALFAPEKSVAKICQISAGTTDSNGVISPAGNIQIEEGKSINFTITPKSGYRILAVAIDGKQIDVENAFTFSNIKGNHTVVAAFAPNHDNEVKPAKDDKKAKEDLKEIKETKKETDLYKETKQSGSEKYDENIMKMENMPDEEEEHEDDDDMDNAMDSLEGTLQDMNITKEKAVEMIDNGEGVELLKRAIVDENLRVNVINDLSAGEYTVAEGMDAIDDPKIGNMAQMLTEIFTKEELLDIVSGEKDVALNICIAESEEKFVSESNRDLIQNNMPAGKTVGTYFNATFVKSIGGNVENVTEFPRPIKITLSIPEDVRGAGREFSVMRLHNNGIGDTEVSVLEDLDDNPDTVTFETDRFSTYAIIYGGEGANNSTSSLQKPELSKGETVADQVLAQNAKKPVNVAIIIGALVALLAAIGIAVKIKKK